MHDRQPCTHCDTPTHTYLCDRCTTELRDNLTGLPRWIGYLRDAANGQTRLGQSTRRSTDKGSPALCRLGPDGSGASSPTQLLTYIRSVLVEWTIDLHNSRRHPIPGVERHADARTAITAIHHAQDSENIAVWLTLGVPRIRHDPHAHVLHREIRQIITDIDHAINRAKPPRYLGPCPTITTDNSIRDAHGKRCATRLQAVHDAVQTQCPTCKTTHRVEGLIAALLTEVDDWEFSQREVLFAMEALGQPVPLRTFRDWRAKNRLTTRHAADGTPTYRLREVRDLANAKPQDTPTGAVAHRKDAR